MGLFIQDVSKLASDLSIDGGQQSKQYLSPRHVLGGQASIEVIQVHANHCGANQSEPISQSDKC